MDNIFICHRTYHGMPATFASRHLSPPEENSNHIHTTNWTLVLSFLKYNLNLSLSKDKFTKILLVPRCAVLVLKKGYKK